MKICYSLLLFIVTISVSFGQGMISGYHAGKHHINLSTYFNYEHYNSFFKGKEKINLPNQLSDITVISSGVFAEYGVTDNLDVSINIPYISAKASADNSPDPQAGIQDIALCVKYSPLLTNHFNLLLSGSVNMPSRNYVINAPVAIGHGATVIDTRIILQYRFHGGLFINGQIGHAYKSTIAPNSISSGIRIGRAGANSYYHLWLENQTAMFGTDIGEGSFPSNRINFLKSGFVFVKPITEIIQVSAGGSYILDGRNIGQAWGLNGGLIFKLTPSDEKLRRNRRKRTSNKSWKKKPLPYELY